MATSKVALQNLLHSIEQKLETLQINLNEVQWSLYLGDKKANPEPIQSEIWKILSRPANRGLAIAAMKKFKTGKIGRRAYLLWVRFECVIERAPAIFRSRDSLNRKIVGFSPTVGGKRVERSDITRILLREESRGKRRKAWEAYIPLGTVIKPRVQGLMSRRNKEARKLGFKTFADYILRPAELTVREVSSLLDRIVRGTQELYDEALEKGRRLIGVGRLEPWDLSHLFYTLSNPLPDRFFRKSKLVTTVLGTAKSLGFGVDKLPIRIVEHDLPFGGLTFAVKIPKDVRILVNPRDGHEHYSTLLHEYGHALHAAYNRQNHFTLKAGEPGCFHEAMAQVTGWIAKTKEWLNGYMGVPEKYVETYLDAVKYQYSFRARSLATDALFEYTAYEDPTQDLDELYSRVYEENMRVKIKPSPRWASSSFYVTHPIYLQNYLIADVVAVQTHHHLRRKMGRIIGNNEVADFLVGKYYAAGALLPWKEKVKKATGKPLSDRALLSEIRTHL